ncbi:MAG: PaaI family thioesterase [Oscillibacter sp.]|nr:PaaI family thioesterase [Oscillibacter sp.]
MKTLYDQIRSSFVRQNFLALLGAELESVEPGQVVISCRRREDLTQQQGFLHGGLVTSIADVTCGYTALTVIPEGQEVLTVEFKINLLRPVTGRKIIAAGSVIKAGKSLVITEAEVTDADSGKIVAKMLATMIPAARKEEAV